MQRWRSRNTPKLHLSFRLHWATRWTWRYIVHPSLLCMLFLIGWPPCQRSDMTLVEVSQHAYDYSYIRTIVLFVFLRNSCKPDMVLVHIFSCDQAALWMVFSVRPSVCHTFLTMFPSSYHHEIFRSYYQWQKWRPCKRSRSEVKGQGHTQLRGFRTVTPVWIHIWCWNDAQSLMLLRRGALLFFKVIRQISRSHGSKNSRIWPKLAVSGL